MSPFDYIIVLESLFVGIAIARLASGIVTMVESREKVTTYWLHLLWIGMVLLFVLNYWWGTWRIFKAVEAFYFGEYLVHVLVPIVLYIIACIISPSSIETFHGDYRAYYYRHSKTIFSFFSGFTILVMINPYGTYSWISTPGVLRAVFLVLFLTLAITRRPRIHEGLSVVMAILFAFAVSVTSPVIQ